MSAQEMVPLGTKLPADQKRKLRVRAAEEGVTMSAYVRELLQSELESE